MHVQVDQAGGDDRGVRIGVRTGVRLHGGDPSCGEADPARDEAAVDQEPSRALTHASSSRPTYQSSFVP